MGMNYLLLTLQQNKCLLTLRHMPYSWSLAMSCHSVCCCDSQSLKASSTIILFDSLGAPSDSMRAIPQSQLSSSRSHIVLCLKIHVFLQVLQGCNVQIATFLNQYNSQIHLSSRPQISIPFILIKKHNADYLCA